MLPATDGRLQFSGATKEALGTQVPECIAACADASDCGGMAFGPDGKGGHKCVLASKSVARSAKLLPENLWVSALKASRGNEVGPSRDKFVFADGIMPIGGKTLDSSRSTDELLADCTKECDADWHCRVVSVHKPKGECKLYDASALPGLKREPMTDGMWAGSVFAEKQEPAPKSEKLTFGKGVRPLASRNIKGMDSTEELLQACREQCSRREKCRAVTVHLPKVGKGRCNMWDERALASLDREQDDTGRFAGEVLPAKNKGVPNPEDPAAPPLPVPETFVSGPGTSCYGARAKDDCKTCDDVVKAYKAKGWTYDKSKFAQCAASSCYGARAKDDCKTCDDVVKAYKAKGWKYDESKFAQCTASNPAAASNPSSTSCYGARAKDDCKTCDDVVKAYEAKGWKYDKSKFAQCAATGNPSSTSCYGARAKDDCKTCDDVVKAYESKGWKYDKSKFTQCTASSPAVASNPATSCYGARAKDDCKTCDDVVKAYKAKGWAYDESKFAQCAAAPKIAENPKPVVAAKPAVTPKPAAPSAPVARPDPVVPASTPAPSIGGGPEVGWFTGTNWFQNAPAAGTVRYTPWSGDPNAGAGAIGKVPYEIAPADMMEPSYAIIRKKTLTGPQTVVLTAMLMLGLIVCLWCFIFFLQSNGITAARIKGMYDSVKAAIPMGRNATFAAITSAVARG